MGQITTFPGTATAAGRLVLDALSMSGAAGARGVPGVVGVPGAVGEAGVAGGLGGLAEEQPARALSRLGDSPGAVRLMRELLTIALRRCFVGRDPRDITAYVADLLDYQSLPAGGELARQTEAVIRSVLGEPELARTIADLRRFELCCYLLGDLVRPPGIPLTDLIALITQAEARVAARRPR